MRPSFEEWIAHHGKDLGVNRLGFRPTLNQSSFQMSFAGFIIYYFPIPAVPREPISRTDRPIQKAIRVHNRASRQVSN